MSNFPMNNQNNQRRVLNFMHYQDVPMLSNQSFVPLSLNQHQERNPESKINLIFGLLRKNTARTNGIWKIIQSLMNKIDKLEELTSSIDQVIARNKQLEEKRMKDNKKKHERKKIKREKRKEDKIRKQNKKEQIKNSNENEDSKIVKRNEKLIKSNLEIIPKREEHFDEKFRNKDSRNDIQISRKEKFVSRNEFSNSINNLEISRTNLINKKKINNKINNFNKDEISFNKPEINNKDDECSLNLKDKINENDEKLSRNNRNKKNVLNLVNRFIFNNANIFNSNQKWISHTFIPLIQDIMDLNLYEIDVTHYVRKVKSPPEFRNEFWQWWNKKKKKNQEINISQIIQDLKRSNDKEIRNLVNIRNLEQD